MQFRMLRESVSGVQVHHPLQQGLRPFTSLFVTAVENIRTSASSITTRIKTQM